MDIIKSLTPKDTEEIKPGLFIQKYRGKYRRIYPAAWNGKFNLKNFITGGPNFWKTTLFFIIILFLVWSYIQDTTSLREFQEVVNEYKFEWCGGVPFEELRNWNISEGVDINEWDSIPLQGDN